ncbi:MAG: carboxymuconolactone decarboxylase family protein [Acidimicrobiia bacterium]|nr:carboxymuconolactone decarboxylase family protein [Acidimicrobiia bacterium]
MPRLAYATPGTEASGATPVYEGLQAQMGMVPNVVQLLGHSAPAAAGLAGVLDTLFNQLSVDPKLREVAYLVAAKTNGCPYCTGHHTMFASQAGWSDNEVARIGPGAGGDPAFDARVQAVAQFAEETTRAVVASDEAIAGMAQHLNSAEMSDIAFTVGAANLVQRIGKNLGAELEF